MARACSESYSQSRAASAVSDTACGEVAVGGTLIALDFIDLFRIGETNTKPADGEMTLRESVDMRATYPQEPAIGAPFTAIVSWQFVRTTNLRQMTYSSDNEVHRNEHVTSSKMITTNKMAYNAGDTLTIQAVLTDGTGARRTQDSTYVVALIDFDKDTRPDRFVMMGDNGTGAYEGSYLIRDTDAVSRWDIYLFAQTVNRARQEDPPEVSARQIGGIMVAAPRVIGTSIVPDAMITNMGRR